MKTDEIYQIIEPSFRFETTPKKTTKRCLIPKKRKIHKRYRIDKVFRKLKFIESKKILPVSLR